MEKKVKHTEAKVLRNGKETLKKMYHVQPLGGESKALAEQWFKRQEELQRKRYKMRDIWWIKGHPKLSASNYAELYRKFRYELPMIFASEEHAQRKLAQMEKTLSENGYSNVIGFVKETLADIDDVDTSEFSQVNTWHTLKTTKAQRMRGQLNKDVYLLKNRGN